ncbi:MAG: hypothetical protein U1D55_05810 [Phycisphaerae bacterium]
MLLAVAGCWSPPRPSVAQLERGLVWLFPGVEGGPSLLETPHRALREAGVDTAMEFHEWVPVFGTLVNLMSYERNRRDAARVAERIVAYDKQYPHRPVDLVGYSGGGGMAVMVAEALPDDLHLRRVLLIHPAVSPDYGLTRVLRHVDEAVVSFSSPSDWLVLGAGTAMFGTMDRKNAFSAGKDGFVVEKAVPDESLRSKLIQHVWSEADLRHGHVGMHAGILGYEWNRDVVAPYLMRGPMPTSVPAPRPSAPSP